MQFVLVCLLILIMANPRNLIHVPLVPDTDTERHLCVVHQNAKSVGNAKKRSAINDFIIENAVDAFFITETWLCTEGDEPKCRDLSPPGYSSMSFPRPTRGGGIAVVISDSLRHHLSFTSVFLFDHDSFELCQASLDVPNNNMSLTFFVCTDHPRVKPIAYLILCFYPNFLISYSMPTLLLVNF